MDNDIAVVKLKGAGFRFDKNVQAICLPDEDVVYEAGMNCTISGFGTDQTGKSGKKLLIPTLCQIKILQSTQINYSRSNV